MTQWNQGREVDRPQNRYGGARHRRKERRPGGKRRRKPYATVDHTEETEGDLTCVGTLIDDDNVGVK
jgi:hypothetical protein